MHSASATLLTCRKIRRGGYLKEAAIKRKKSFLQGPAHLLRSPIRFPLMKSYKYNAMLHECMLIQVLEKSISHKSEESESASAPSDEDLSVHACKKNR